MKVNSNNIKREFTIKGKNNKSFKLIIIKEKDEIKFESNILGDIFNIQYTSNLYIKQFYEHNKIFKKYKSINELYSEIFKNIEEKDIIMSTNNNKIETYLNINNNKILFILEPEEIKLDIKIFNNINKYTDKLRNEIMKQKNNNEKDINELKKGMEKIKIEIFNKNKAYEEKYNKLDMWMENENDNLWKELIKQKNNNEKKYKELKIEMEIFKNEINNKNIEYEEIINLLKNENDNLRKELIKQKNNNEKKYKRIKKRNGKYYNRNI